MSFVVYGSDTRRLLAVIVSDYELRPYPDGLYKRPVAFAPWERGSVVACLIALIILFGGLLADWDVQTIDWAFRTHIGFYMHACKHAHICQVPMVSVHGSAARGSDVYDVLSHVGSRYK